MIKTPIIIGTLVAVAAFAAGCYVGWQTTLRVLDSALARRQAPKG